ncbi:DNA polymerase III subunit alpha [bacterium]|nr:MAG: DNA polymerase III subunit alpha [bacterium]
MTAPRHSSRAGSAAPSTPSRAGRSKPSGGTSPWSASTGRRCSTATCCASCTTTSRATNGSWNGSTTEHLDERCRSRASPAGGRPPEARLMRAPYVELHCHSNFSFLDGGSHPAELAARAAELEMPALAITDRGGVYGAVKFLQACRKLGVKPLIGTALEVDGQETVVIARNLRGYSNLCRLLSLAHADQPKGEARATLTRVAEHKGDLFYLSATDDERRLRELQEALGNESVFSELHHHLRPEDPWVLEGRASMAKRCGAAVVATNQVHYHVPERRRLHDVLVAIRHRTTLDGARPHLFPNAEHHLKAGDEMRPLFKGHAEALAAPWDIAQECAVELDFRKVRFPGYPVPAGETPFSFLYKLCFEGVRERYRPITPEVARRLQRELEVIEKTGLAEFFLINWDLMRFAREHGVPGQGRGSAADSIVAYVLGITRVDPIEHNLLFERFLHEEMTSTPDIDIDFSTKHREQVIQYVYDKYGWERTGMVCNVVTFQPRMAIRQVGKALGFSAELLDRLAKGVDRWPAPGEMLTPPGNPTEGVEDSMTGAMPPPADMRPQSWQQFLELCREVIEFPRHLSIHVGGMLVTGEPLVDIVPVEPATMEGRRVVQFNKDDVEDLGLIKVDLLGLRTLSVVAETLDLIQDTTGTRPDLDRLPLDDPKVFEMCSEADTIGVFQIESRAQMQTLPRTRPQSFNDLVVEVAIIRPGPIQGNAVHPYIRRKQGREPVIYAHPLLEPVLKDTLGVILYQEQIIEIAMRVAGMTPSQADGFRRAMTRHLNRVEMSSLEGDFINGCLANSVPREVADQLFAAVQGFAVYGFCRSHAAAFARTTYETAWLKLNYPVEFGCGLLNHQPMGFYHPSVLVEDLKRHGVKVLPVDVNRSYARCLPEPLALSPTKPQLAEGPPSSTRPSLPRRPTEISVSVASTQAVKAQAAMTHAMRIGLNYVRDLGEDGRNAIVAERRRAGPYSSFDDFLNRLRGGPIGPRAVRNLVMVGAFDALRQPRRKLLWGWQERWHGHGLRRGLGTQAELRLNGTAPDLPAVDEFDANQLEYRISDLSTGHHLIHFCRDRLRAMGALESNQLPSIPDRHRVRVAGLVITRQAPSTAKKIRFFTLEDEFGQVNVTIKPDVYDRYRHIANRQPILIIDGVMQRQDGVWSVLASHIEALRGVPRPQQRSHDYR